MFDITNQKEAERKIHNYNQKLRTELKFASNLQKLITAPEKVNLDGYQIYTCYISSDKVAGVYLDIIPVDHKVYIISADVSEHGLIASFFPFILKGHHQNQPLFQGGNAQ